MSQKCNKDVVCILTWYIENNSLIIYQSFTNNLLILLSCYIANHLPVIYQSSTNGLQWFTNAIFMLLSLPFLYQSFSNQLHPFHCISHIVAVASNSFDLMYQCFTNYYQSHPVLYISSVPIITNKLPIHHYQS